MKVINTASKRYLLRSNAAGNHVSRKLESNPPTLHTYIFIHIGIDAIIKASKIGEASTKIKVEISLLVWFMLRSHAAENVCFENKLSSISRRSYE